MMHDETTHYGANYIVSASSFSGQKGSSLDRKPWLHKPEGWVTIAAGNSPVYIGGEPYGTVANGRTRPCVVQPGETVKCRLVTIARKGTGQKES